MKDWFPHDYHASQDLEIIRLLMKHGAKGYGVFWLATELLHANDLVTRSALLDVLLHKFNDLNADCIDEILDDLIRYGLFKTADNDHGDEDDIEIYSERVMRNKEARTMITESKKAAAHKRWQQSKANAMQQQSKSNASAMPLQDITLHYTTKDNKHIDHAIISFECTGSKTFHVEQSAIDEMKELYPNVDILGELRKMKGWLIGNNTRKKTTRGMPRFMHNWLAKAQDNGPKHSQQQQTTRDKIGERANKFSTLEYDQQIKSIAEQAIIRADQPFDQTDLAISQTSSPY